MVTDRFAHSHHLFLYRSIFNLKKKYYFQIEDAEDPVPAPNQIKYKNTTCVNQEILNPSPLKVDHFLCFLFQNQCFFLFKQIRPFYCVLLKGFLPSFLLLQLQLQQREKWEREKENRLKGWALSVVYSQREKRCFFLFCSIYLSLQACLLWLWLQRRRSWSSSKVRDRTIWVFRYIQKQIFLYCNLYCYGLEFGFGLSALYLWDMLKKTAFLSSSAPQTHTQR